MIRDLKRRAYPTEFAAGKNIRLIFLVSMQECFYIQVQRLLTPHTGQTITRHIHNIRRRITG